MYWTSAKKRVGGKTLPWTGNLSPIPQWFAGRALTAGRAESARENFNGRESPPVIAVRFPRVTGG